MRILKKLNAVAFLAAPLMACEASTPTAQLNDIGKVNSSQVAESEVRSNTNTASLRQLNSDEIRTALVGNLVSNTRPGTADAGVHEEFHEDGRWSGTRYSRGPIPFAGRWYIEPSQLCVIAEPSLVAGQLREGPLCRAVYRDDQNRVFLMEDAMQQGHSPLQLSVRSISSR